MTASRRKRRTAVPRAGNGPATSGAGAPSGRAGAAAVYFASFVALGLVVASLGPTLPGLAALTQSPLASASGLFVARAIGYMVGTLGGGRVYDRLPAHPVLAIVLAAIAGSMALAPTVPLLWFVTLALAVVGIAEGMIDVGVNTVIVWEFRERSSSRLNALHACFGIGAFLSPLIVAEADAAGGVAWAYRALALSLLPLPLLLLRVPSPPHPARDSSAVPKHVDGRLVALLTLFFFVYVGSEAALSGWVYTYAVATKLGTTDTGAYLTSGFWGALAVGRMISVPIAGRVEPIATLAAAMTAGLASVALVLLVPGSVTVLWIGTLGAGASLAAVFPTALALAGRHLPVTGTVNSWFFAGASLSGIGLPWLVGQYFESIGPSVTFSLVAADLVVSLCVLGAIAFFVRRQK